MNMAGCTKEQAGFQVEMGMIEEASGFCMPRLGNHDLKFKGLYWSAIL
jgi:hypothetical protein